MTCKGTANLLPNYHSYAIYYQTSLKSNCISEKERLHDVSCERLHMGTYEINANELYMGTYNINGADSLLIMDSF